MWLPVVIAKLLSLAIDLAKKKPKQNKRNILAWLQFFSSLTVGIYIYNATDACMTKGNENALAFIKLLLDLLYSYKHYAKITPEFRWTNLESQSLFLYFLSIRSRNKNFNYMWPVPFRICSKMHPLLSIESHYHIICLLNVSSVYRWGKTHHY